MLGRMTHPFAGLAHRITKLNLRSWFFVTARVRRDQGSGSDVGRAGTSPAVVGDTPCSELVLATAWALHSLTRCRCCASECRDARYRKDRAEP